MVADHSLFLLIKSLSQAEKRYFKVFTGRHIIGSQNRYVELFDAIDRQVKREEYNERKLIHFFKTKIAHFPSAKHYLFEMILKSLRAFYEGELIYQQVNDRITDIKLLMRRGLYKKSAKVMASAKKMAIEIDNSRLLLELLHIERALVRFLEKKSLLEIYQKIEFLEKECINKINYESQYVDLKDHLHTLVQQELTLHDPKVKSQLTRLAKNELLKNKETAASFTSRWNYFVIRSDQARLLDYPSESKENMKLLVELFEQKPIMQKEYGADYIYILSNYLNSCFLQHDFEEFPIVLQKIKNFRIKSREDEFIIFNNGVFLELLYLIITDNLEDALKLVPYIKEGMKKFRDKLTKANELAFLSTVVAIYFLMERWQEALDWVNKIILYKTGNLRMDIQSASRIMQLLMHYELKNYDLVDYLLRADLRYYRKHNRYFPFERICLQLFTALLKSPVKKKNKKIFTEYRDKLIEFRKKNKEFITGYPEIFSWVESQVNEKPLRTIFANLQPMSTK